jgi:hypothetical protein
MNIQFFNVSEVIEMKVGEGGRITGLKKYEGSIIKIVVFDTTKNDVQEETSKRSGQY